MSVIALQTIIYKGIRYNLGDEIIADTEQENAWVKNEVVKYNDIQQQPEAITDGFVVHEPETNTPKQDGIGRKGKV